MTKYTIRILYLILFIVALILISYCSSNGHENSKPKRSLSVVQTFYKQPVSIQISNPILINLDKCPPPQKIIVPVSQKDRTTIVRNGKFIKLVPPTVHLFIDSITHSPVAAGNQGAVFFTNYTTDDGLALDAIYCTFIDKLGNLWFGTYGGGVSRYDGRSFTNFTSAQGLVNDAVRSIVEDNYGNLWFGTNRGISRYDGKSFTNFTTSQGLANDAVRCIANDKSGNIWFGTNDGASYFDGQSFTNYSTVQGLSDNVVYDIEADKAGNLWFGTKKGLCRYDGKSFTNFNTSNGLVNNEVLQIAVDRTGNLWFGTIRGVSRYDGKSFINYTTAQGLSNNQINSIIEDKDGNIWFGTEGGGVSRYDGKSFINFNIAQGLANNLVNCITEDKEGNLWIGTHGGGISRYDGKSFTHFTTNQGLLDSFVSSIAKDRTDNLWFGTRSGIICYDGKSFKRFTTSQGLVNNYIRSILVDKKGNLWLGTDDGVSYYDGRCFINFTNEQGLVNNTVWTIYEDKQGAFWFGTNGGASRYNGKSFTSFTTSQGLSNNYVRSFIEDKEGNLWIGTYNGASRYDGKSFTNYTIAQGLANNTIWSIMKDKAENLWFGTNSGICRYDGKTFINFTSRDGLPDNEVTQVLTDSHQNIVIGTNFGIGIMSSFTPNLTSENTRDNIQVQNNLENEELKNYTPKIEIFNSKTGYPVKDVNAGQTIFNESNGIIWIATGAFKTGLLRFDPSALNHNVYAPTVLIQSIKINNEIICWNDLQKEHEKVKDSLSTQSNIIEESYYFNRELHLDERVLMAKKFGNIEFSGITKFYSLPENLVLPHKFNNITFDFTVIEPARASLVKYQFILDSYNSDWSSITNKTSATFGNIFEGTYTFRLKAQSPSGAWSEPITYTFKVLPPWWRTWWMYVIYGITIIVAISLIVWWNSKRLRKRAAELETEVQLATAEIVRHKKEIEEKHKEITESINYALKVQTCILPSPRIVNKYLPHSFIFYLPKAIVSGDFYWIEKVEDVVLFAACDCTGHGVPGALISMVCQNALSRAVNELKLVQPAAILDKSGEFVLANFAKSENNLRDGMDISLCAYNAKTNILEWAGANNPLWLLRDGELIETKADCQSIGNSDNIYPFTNHQFKLNPGDSIYIFSDGYADQSGPDGKKRISKKRFAELILSIQRLTMQEQKRELENYLSNYRKEVDQRDDVLVIGVKI